MIVYELSVLVIVASLTMALCADNHHRITVSTRMLIWKCKSIAFLPRWYGVYGDRICLAVQIEIWTQLSVAKHKWWTIVLPPHCITFARVFFLFDDCDIYSMMQNNQKKLFFRMKNWKLNSQNCVFVIRLRIWIKTIRKNHENAKIDWWRKCCSENLTSAMRRTKHFKCT